MSARNIPDYLNNKYIDQSELIKVLTEGVVDEKIDNYNNQIIDIKKTDAQNHLVVIKQSKVEYSPDSIEQNFNTSFSELINEERIDDSLNIDTDVKDLSIEHLRKEAVLQGQVEELTKVLEMETARGIKAKEDSEQNYNAMKSIIIQQRIQNGEGVDPSEFQDAFPFLPKKDSNNPTSSSYNPEPFATEPT